MTKELIFVMDRFPGHRVRIAELYDCDQDFRQLCNDYCLSMNMLEAFRKTEPDIRKVRHDYEQVSKDLERELLNLFEKGNK